MSKLNKVTHINYPDNLGRVYCRKTNKLKTMDKDGKFWDECTQCSHFSGDYQGQGVECTWDDTSEDFSAYVSDPVKESLRVSKLIDDGELNKD